MTGNECSVSIGNIIIIKTKKNERHDREEVEENKYTCR